MINKKKEMGKSFAAAKLQAKRRSLLAITAIIAVIGFLSLSLTGCPNPDDESGGDDGDSGVNLKDLSGNVTISPNSGDIYTGMELTANYDGTEEITIWQWKKDGTAITGETNQEYTPWEGGNYTVTVSANGYKTKTSAAVTVTLFTPDAGLYASAPPILPSNADTRISTVNVNDVAAAVTYVKSNAGPYTLLIDNDASIGPQTLNTTNVKLTIIGIGAERKINLNAQGALFTVGASGQTGIELTIDNNITLVGLTSGVNGAANDNNSSVVNVQNSAIFTMHEGSKVTGNRAIYTATTGAGSAVNIDGGTFNLKGGHITGNDINHPNNTPSLRTSGLRTASSAIINLSGGSISGNTGSYMGIDVVLVQGVTFNLSGSVVIGGIAAHSDPSPAVISIPSNWTGKVNKLYLAGNGDMNAVISTWEDKTVLQGTGLNTAIVANVTLGDFYRAQANTGTTGASQPIANTHKIENSGANIGKLVRTAFSTAPVLTLTPESTKLKYTWTASSPTADSYDVYWKEGNGLTAAQVKTGTKITGATSGGEISGLTNGTAYSVVVVAIKAGLTSIDSAVQTGTPVISPYIITGSGTTFTATRNGTTVGTANQPIQTVINGIKTNAGNNNAVTIQFGSGANNVLDISSSSIEFNNTSGTWGAITITGKIQGNNSSSSTEGRGEIISTTGNVSVTSTADISNTATSNYRSAVFHASTGTFTISGGTVQATNYMAIFNNSTGTINISGGTVSGGSGQAIINNSTGKITVSGTANITSTIQASNSGTIVIRNSGTLTTARLEISGGTVTNTGTSNANAIYNASTGAITISGGNVSTTVSGNALYNTSSGAINVSGGTIQAAGNDSTAIYSANGKITISGTAKVTSENSDVSYGASTILIVGTGGIEVLGGTVENTAANASARAISSRSGGAIIISGGTVQATGNGQTGGMAIYSSDGSADITISGGTVQATSVNGKAISSVGKITISGTALVTSINGSGEGTIIVGSNGLEISGGTVSNTIGGTVISNGSANGGGGAVTISGGTVSTTGSYALLQEVNKTTTISGGTISTTGENARAIYINGGKLDITGGTVQATGTGGRAVQNQSTGTVNITAGTITGTGYSIYNNSGVVTVTKPPAVITGDTYGTIVYN